MKAIVYHAPGDIRIEEIPKPSCGKEELLVKVDACAVCGTDLKSQLHGNPRIKAPLPMGHEFTGLVEEVGSEAAGDFASGDRVVMATSISCGRCFYCRRGWRNLCVDLAPMGFSYPGGMAEYTTIPSRALQQGHVLKTPTTVPAEQAALAEPVSCAVNSIGQCHIEKGDTVLVMGAGPMGLLNALVARAEGAEKILLSEVNEHRLKQGEAFGIDVLIDPTQEDLTDRVEQETEGIGVDVVVVAAPAAQPQEQAISLVRKQGTVCLFASLPVGKNMLQLDSRAIHYGELRVVGTSDSTPRHVEKAIELIASGAVQAEKIVSHQLPLEEVHQAFDLMTSGEALRVVLVP